MSAEIPKPNNPNNEIEIRSENSDILFHSNIRFITNPFGFGGIKAIHEKTLEPVKEPNASKASK